MRLETSALAVFLLSYTLLGIWPSESRFYLLNCLQIHSKVITFPIYTYGNCNNKYTRDLTRKRSFQLCTQHTDSGLVQTNQDIFLTSYFLHELAFRPYENSDSSPRNSSPDWFKPPSTRMRVKNMRFQKFPRVYGVSERLE